MTTIRSIFIALALTSVSLTALADSDDDHRHKYKHKHKHKHGEYKEEYWDGNCKVKREYGKNGKYEEERKCKGYEGGYYAPSTVYVPAPSRVIVQPGVRIDGTVIIGN